MPNVGFLRYEPGVGFPLHKHDFAQIWYVIEGEFRTETGGTVLFVQYPGPTTGARPIYEGRMNLKAAPPAAELDLEH